MPDKNKASIWAWALYDWGNSAFTTTVVAGFFPVFFKQYWSAGIGVTESTLYLANANSISSLVIVLCAPVLGAIADRGGTRRQFLFAFAVLGIIATAGFYFVGKGQWAQAWWLYVISNVGFAGSLIFYDALLLNVAREDQFDKASAFGFALGYLGGGLLFALNVAMTLAPSAFGLADVADAVRWSFVSVAVWWLVFTFPLMLRVKESVPARANREGVVRAGFRQLVNTFHHVRSLQNVFLFLLAYWCYIDGVDTIIRMAVDYGLALGFPSESLIIALLITQFVGFPAAILFGHLGMKYGPKLGIFIGIVVYTGVVAWGVRMAHVWEFYTMAVVIGLVQGGIQSLSRSLYARLIPPDKSAEFFGFYNILGKFSSILGPVLVGWTSVLTGSPRLSLLSLVVLFALGAWFLRGVRVQTRTAPA